MSHEQLRAQVILGGVGLVLTVLVLGPYIEPSAFLGWAAGYVGGWVWYASMVLRRLRLAKCTKSSVDPSRGSNTRSCVSWIVRAQGLAWASLYVLALRNQAHTVHHYVLMHCIGLVVVSIALPARSLMDRATLLVPPILAANWPFLTSERWFVAAIVIATTYYLIWVGIRARTRWADYAQARTTRLNRAIARLKQQVGTQAQTLERTGTYHALAGQEVLQPVQALAQMLDRLSRAHANEPWTAELHKAAGLVNYTTKILQSSFEEPNLQQHLLLRPLHLSTAVPAWVCVHESQALDKQLELDVLFEPVTFLTDEVLLNRLLSRLLSNALSVALPGRVHVKGTASTAGYKFEISYIGPVLYGAPATQLGRAMSIGDEGSVNQRLLAAIQAAKRLGYALRCNASHEARASVTLEVPRSAIVDLSRKRQESELAAGDDHILLVDDDAVALELTATWLLEAGYSVNRCTTSAQARDLIDYPWSMVIADANIEARHCGLELLSDFAQRGTPTMMVTGDVDPSLASLARKRGVAYVLHKPARARTFLERVNAASRPREHAPSEGRRQPTSFTTVVANG